MSKRPSPAELNRIITALLRQHTNTKLLDLKTGAQLYAFLLLHPSPKEAVKAIAKKRPAEDLMMLQMTLGIANKWLRAEFPDTDEQLLLNRAVALVDLLKSESPAFRKYTRLIQTQAPADRKGIEKAQKMLTDFIRAHERNGFDAEAYASAHPDLLSFGFDAYLIVLALNAKGTDNEQEHLIDAVWATRVELFEVRTGRA